MQHVKPLVRDAGDKANEIVLPSKKNQEGYLSDGQPSRSDAKRLVMLRTWDVIVDELESKDKA